MNKKFKYIIGTLVGALLIYQFFIYDEAKNLYYASMEAALKAKEADKRIHPVFAGEVEPDLPDPKENFRTILGIDKNNNGIRDDVDIWINRTGKNYNEIMALRQTAKGDQAFLKAAVEKRYWDAESTMNMSIHGEKCIDVVFSSDKKRTLSELMIHRLGLIEYYPRVRGKTVVGFYKNILSYGGGEGGERAFTHCSFKLENQDEVMKNYVRRIGLNSEVVK